VDPERLGLGWSQLAAAHRDALLERLNVARGMLSNPGPTPPNHPPTDRRPLPHQSAAVRAMRALQWRVMLTDDMGLGKTSEALWAAHDAEVLGMVILCPASVKHNWKREIAVTLGAAWTTFVIDGTPKHRASLFSEVEFERKKGGTPLAVICNYDLLPVLSEAQLDVLKKVCEGDLLICDESHYLKNRNAKRTKATVYIAEAAQFRLLLTGTPVRNLVDDLYQQVEIVHPGTWTSYHDFANRHLVIQPIDYGSGRPVNKVVAGKNIPALNAVMNTLQIRRKKEDVLDLPPKIHTFPALELDDTTKKVYRAMKEYARIVISELDPSVSVFDPQAKSAVEAVMRCEQIAQGFVGGIPEPLMQKLSDAVLKGAEKIPGRPNELIFPKSAKLAWLLETIEDLLTQENNVLVFTRFNAPMFWLQKQINAKVLLLHGGLDNVEKDDVIQEFQREARVLIAQVKMAEGWNATRAQDVLFLGRDWSPAINSQAEDRTHRIGQKGTVNVQIPVMLDTIEVPIHKRLQAKANAAESALKNVTLADLAEML